VSVHAKRPELSNATLVLKVSNTNLRSPPLLSTHTNKCTKVKPSHGDGAGAVPQPLLPLKVSTNGTEAQKRSQQLADVPPTTAADTTGCEHVVPLCAHCAAVLAQHLSAVLNGTNACMASCKALCDTCVQIALSHKHGTCRSTA
jgi:hypothetical protein